MTRAVIQREFMLNSVKDDTPNRTQLLATLSARDPNSLISDQHWEAFDLAASKLFALKNSVEVLEKGKPTVETVEVAQAALTSDKIVSDLYHWAREYEGRRELLARYAYTTDTASLPTAVREHFEPYWSSEARRMPDGIGGLPRWGGADLSIFMREFYYPPKERESYFAELPPYAHVYPAPFNKDNALLLQLSSDNLVGWIWGDLDDIFFIIPYEDLVANSFDRVEAIISQ